jgi:hypothetical protein
MEVKTGVCKVLVGKCKRKRPLGRARYKWDFNIKRMLRKSIGGVDCIAMDV